MTVAMRFMGGCDTSQVKVISKAGEAFHLLSGQPLGIDKTCLFTISAFNNYGFVKSFLKRVEKLHPDLLCLVWVVADNVQDWAPHGMKNQTLEILHDVQHSTSWIVITIDQLQPFLPGGVSFVEMAFRYDMVCFNTALKAAAFRYIFEHRKASKVLFFDNDIWILQPLTTLINALDKYSMVLTPHTTQPIPVDGLRQEEREILLAGQFNFGFFGLAASETTFHWLDWWNHRLRFYAFAKPDKGMHFDQNWANMIASYYPQTKYLILRDPRYNVAYWNLHYRGAHLHLVQDQVMYDRDPVVFIHFSGMSDLLHYNMESISRHQNRFNMSNFPKLRPIFEKYISILIDEGAMRWRHVPYGFCCFDDGMPISQAVREYYAEMLDPATNKTEQANVSEAFRELVDIAAPFRKHDTGLKMSVIQWIWQPVRPPNPLVPDWFPEILWRIYLDRKDLRSKYPNLLGKDTKRLLHWFEKRGFLEYHLDREQMLPLLDLASKLKS